MNLSNINVAAIEKALLEAIVGQMEVPAKPSVDAMAYKELDSIGQTIQEYIVASARTTDALRELYGRVDRLLMRFSKDEADEADEEDEG